MLGDIVIEVSTIPSDKAVIAEGLANTERRLYLYHFKRWDGVGDLSNCTGSPLQKMAASTGSKEGLGRAPESSPQLCGLDGLQ